MTAHRRHKLLDFNGDPVITEDIKIAQMVEIDRTLFDNLPQRMECRLFNAEGREPAIVLFHPKSELFVLISLGHDFEAGPMDLAEYVAQMDGAVLKQAMGEPPEDGQGYRVHGR